MFEPPTPDAMNKHGTLTLPSGEALFDRAWLPPHPQQAKEVVLCLHGVESHAGWFDELARQLTVRGYVVHAYDRVGWGQSAGARGHLAGYGPMLARLCMVVGILRENYERVHLVGLSWGGLFALYAMLRRAPLFDSLTLIAPGLIPLADLSWWRKLGVGVSIVIGRRDAQVPIPIHTQDFTNREDVRTAIEQDPQRTTHVTAQFCFETLKMRAFCREQLPLRKLPRWSLLLADEDRIVDNAAMRTLVMTADVSVKQYQGMAHSLVFENPERVAKDIAERAAARMPQSTRKHIAVMGAGAVGSVVGGLLALRGHEVTLIARAPHAEAVNANGLTIQLGAGTRIVRENLRGVTSAAMVDRPVDLVVLAVKSFDTETALDQIRPLIGEKTAILSLQNGIGNEQQIADAYPESIVIGGAICAYLQFAAPGVIVWSDDRGGLAGGVAQGHPEQARALWESILPDTCMEAAWCRDGRRVKWSKLILNVAFNALNAATGLSTAEILAHHEFGTLAAQALKEGFAVMRACGVAPVDLPGYPVTRMARLCNWPVRIVRPVLARVTAHQTKTVSSMQQDLAKGRGSTEIDEINGMIVREGAVHQIATPANEALCEMMRVAAQKTNS